MDLFHKLNLSFRHKLPVLRQTQAAECGLTCVGMIAGYYGYQIDMVSLRHRFPSSQKAVRWPTSCPLRKVRYGLPGGTP